MAWNNWDFWDVALTRSERQWLEDVLVRAGYADEESDSILGKLGVTESHMDKMMHDEILDGMREAVDILRDLLALKTEKDSLSRRDYQRRKALLWAQADLTVDRTDRPVRHNETNVERRAAAVHHRHDLARATAISEDERRNGCNTFEQLRGTLKACLEATVGILEVNSYNFGPGDPPGLQVRTAGGIMAYIHITGDDASRR